MESRREYEKQEKVFNDFFFFFLLKCICREYHNLNEYIAIAIQTFFSFHYNESHQESRQEETSEFKKPIC